MRITTRVELLFHRIGILLAVPLVASLLCRQLRYIAVTSWPETEARVFHPNKASAMILRKIQRKNREGRTTAARDAAFDAVLTELAQRQIIACSAKRHPIEPSRHGTSRSRSRTYI